jgi:hypothetical protein
MNKSFIGTDSYAFKLNKQYLACDRRTYMKNIWERVSDKMKT